jgi:predicted enzyme related to lactoylglutathione lyase
MTTMQPRVSLITLGVRDLPRARAFYEQGMGWPVSSASNESVCFFQLPGMALALYGREALAEDAHVPPEGQGFRGITLAYNTHSKAEVDAVIAHACRVGGTLLKPAQDVFWGGYSGYFADPEGHLWEVAWNPFFPLDAGGAVRLP